MLTLTVSRRRELSALAHTINPVVMIGKIGVSTAVIDELDQGLLSHELIKVKVFINDRKTRETLFGEICQQLSAAPVQHIGKMLVIYRPKPEEMKAVQVNSPRKKKRGSRYTKRHFQT